MRYDRVRDTGVSFPEQPIRKQHMAWFCLLSSESCKVEQGRARDYRWRLQGMAPANHLQEDKVPNFPAISSGRHWVKLLCQPFIAAKQKPLYA